MYQGDDRRSATVTHETLLEKLVEHEDAILNLNTSLTSINGKLDPIVRGIGSIAFAFKALLALGAVSAAVVAIIELLKYTGG